MILVDLNQVMISNVLQQIGTSGDLDENLFRHMILNSLRSYKSKFGAKYGDIIICCDDRHFWRRDEFPYYKAHRKKARTESKHDWDMIFAVLNEVRSDLETYFPYLVIGVERAEADDVIAALCHDHGRVLGASPPILILSSDKDFVQLQKYSNVEQYSGIQKKFVRHPNPELYLQEHIMKGDRGDGVPNFLSDDDTFVTEKRQKPIEKKKLAVWVELEPEEFCDENMLRNWHRNNTLVNLDNVPDEIRKSVSDIYNNGPKGDRSKLFGYFVKKKLKGLMESIGDF